ADVRRLRGAGGARRWPRLDGLKGKRALLVGWTAAKAPKRVGGERSTVGRMGVAALIVGLPDLKDGIGHDIALPIENAALDANVGTGQAGVGQIGAENLARPIRTLGEANVQIGAYGLGGCALRHGRGPTASPCCPAERCRSGMPAPTRAASLPGRIGRS